MEHLHEEGGVGSVALHVLEIQEVLPSLGHRPGNRLFQFRFSKNYISGFLSQFTSVRGFGLTAGCTSPENRKGINFHQ